MIIHALQMDVSRASSRAHSSRRNPQEEKEATLGFELKRTTDN